MMDVVLASIHHLAAFGLVSLAVTEVVLLRDRLDPAGIRRFSRVDAFYGIAAGTVVLAGIGRLAFGAMPAGFYFSNAFFWLKMAAFVAVAAVSVVPTVLGIRWRRALKGDPSYEAPASDVRRLRTALLIELAIIPIIPVAAALMARGIGAF